MSILDKIASSIMPPESAEDRANARSVARAVAGQNDWLATILQHHQQIEAAFGQANGASGSRLLMAATKARTTSPGEPAPSELLIVPPRSARSRLHRPRLPGATLPLHRTGPPILDPRPGLAGGLRTASALGQRQEDAGQRLGAAQQGAVVAR